MTQSTPAKPSILKNKPKTVFKGGYNVVQSRNASVALVKKRKDFYGNAIDKEKRHKIFLNLSENVTVVVENWKAHNYSEKSEKLNNVKCTIF